MRLENKVAIVTGGAKGLGGEMAQLFAKEGAKVIAADMIPLSYEAENVEYYQLNVADGAACEALFNYAKDTYGRIDVLVNNAGVYHAAPLLDCTPEDFDHVMQVNLYGAYHVMQLALRHMRDRGRGKVVNIASTAGKGGSMNQSAYNASKHALVGLTRCAAQELGPLGICINAICPGFVETDMLQSFSAHSAITGLSFEQIMANGKARVPLRRFLKPEEIAHLAVYLGSAESDGMTGQSILLDGGMLMV